MVVAEFLRHYFDAHRMKERGLGDYRLFFRDAFDDQYAQAVFLENPSKEGRERFIPLGKLSIPLYDGNAYKLFEFVSDQVDYMLWNHTHPNHIGKCGTWRTFQSESPCYL